MRTIIIALLASLLLGPAAMAETHDASSASPALTALTKKWHLTVVKKFPTREPGLTGYVVKEPSGATRLLFAMGAYVFSGTLIDADGKNATRAYAKAELPKPDYAAAAKKLLQDPHLLTEGRKGAPQLFVFADPNCIFCHQLWENTRDWVHDGKIRIHWVMVAFLKSSSPGRAAAIMAAKDGAMALAKDETDFDKAQEEGAIKPLKPIPADLEKALKRHGRMMAQLNFNGTPSLIYRDHNGKWHGESGVPKAASLAKALGFKP